VLITASYDNTDQRTPRWLIALLWFVLSAVAAIGLLALQALIGADVVAAVMFAPAIGTGICWLIWRDRALPHLESATGRALLGSLALGLVYVLVAGIVMVPGSPGPGTDLMTVFRPAGVPVLVFVLAQILGAAGEELGFRGILLHNLAARIPVPAAVLVTGALFGIWHVQYYALGLPTMLVFIAGTIAMTAAIAAIMTGSLWQRMLSAALVHAGLNLLGTATGAGLLHFGLAALAGGVVVVPIAIGLRRTGLSDAR
jgi:membrane protease YdiL (CAAX protease family)